MTIKAVVFDMDGTLVDSEKVSFAAWDKTAEIMGLDIPDTVVRSFLGRNYDSYRSLLIEHLGGDENLGDSVLDQHTKSFFEIAKTELELKPGAREALEALSGIGLPMAVATSTPRAWAEPRLARFNLQRYFKSMTCGDEVENSKPAPDIFIAAAKSLGIDPCECAAVEDSFTGVKAAYDAGMNVFMVPDLIKPTAEVASQCVAVIDTLHELPSVICAAQ